MPYKFIRLDRSFFTGTMYVQPATTRLVFIAMILECSDGIFTGTVDYLARFANLEIEAVEAALIALQTPDKDSTSPHEDGRRIVPVLGSKNMFQIVNWATYQPALASSSRGADAICVLDENGEKVSRFLPGGRANPAYQRLYQRQYRARQKAQRSASKHLSIDLEKIGNVNQNLTEFTPEFTQVQNSLQRKLNSLQNSGEFEPENVNFVKNVNEKKIKENKIKENTNTLDGFEIVPVNYIEPHWWEHSEHTNDHVQGLACYVAKRMTEVVGKISKTKRGRWFEDKKIEQAGMQKIAVKLVNLAPDSESVESLLQSLIDYAENAPLSARKTVPHLVLHDWIERRGWKPQNQSKVDPQMEAMRSLLRTAGVENWTS